MNTQQMMEEIDRLAKLCEAKDAQLSVSQTQIAMQAEALATARTYIPENPLAEENIANAKIVDAALSATAETIAAFRAKETEPLRREVAMLRDAINKYLHPHNLSPTPNRLASHAALMSAINNTQATALAYEREVENRGAVKALEDAAKICDEEAIGCDSEDDYIDGYGSAAVECASILRRKSSEIRANKGEVK